MRKRPEFIPKAVFRIWFKPQMLNKYFLIDNIKPSSFINRRETEGRPITNKDGRYRPIDLFAIALANNYDFASPRVVSKTEELKILTKEIEHLRRTIENLHEYLKPEVVTISQIAGEQVGCRLLREKEIAQLSKPLKRVCGVYFLLRDNAVVYVGQSTNVETRIYSHRATKSFDSACYIKCARSNLDILESLYIHLFEPEYNYEIGHGTEKGSKHAPVSLKEIITNHANKSLWKP